MLVSAQIAQKINLYLLHVLLLLISFFEEIVPISLVVVLVMNLVLSPWSERLTLFKQRKKFILTFIALYLLSVIGVLYSEDKASAFFDLEVKLSTLVVPLVFLTSNVVNKNTFLPLLKSFVIGVCVVMLIQLIMSLMNYYDTGNFKVFFYQLFSFFHHPSYFSMYANFAIGVLLVLIFHSKNKTKSYYFMMLGFLAVGVYLLSSRAGILTLIVLVVTSFGLILFPVLKWKKMFLAMILTCVTVGAVVFGINQLSSFGRKVEISNSDSSSGVRIQMWKSSVPVIKNNLIFGVGTGDVNREIQTQFAKDGITRAVRDNLNAHNQYIQTQIALGFFGLIALVFSLLYPFIFALKRGNLFFPMFAVIMAINFLTESMFNAQAGVIFYAIINACLYPTYGD